MSKGVFALAFAAAGCVPLPPGAIPETGGAITRSSFRDLDPGGKSVASLHFEVRAYGEAKAKEISDLAERDYERIMLDTDLYSFMPSGLYPILLYANQAEYMDKTGMPRWSGGATQGNALCTFEGPQAPSVLAHEMTHLIFNEGMGPRVDQRWLNEGLAVYEEEQVAPRGDHIARPIPFAEMMRLAPLGEHEQMVGDWYAQVSSVVRFMIERGGRVGFSQFLKAVRDGRPLDEAVHTGFPGLWSSMSELEAAWQRSL